MPNLLKNSNINLESGNLRPEIRRWSLESENWHPDARIMESTPENGAQEWRGQTLVLRGTLAPAGQNGGTARAAWGSSRGLWGTFVEATESCKMRQAGRINPQNKWSKCHFYLALGQGLGSSGAIVCPAGAHWGLVGTWLSNFLGCIGAFWRRGQTVVIEDVDGFQYPAGLRAEMDAPQERSAKYGTWQTKITCF